MKNKIENLREELYKAIDSQNKELRLQISQELDEVIVEYIREGEILTPENPETILRTHSRRRYRIKS